METRETETLTFFDFPIEQFADRSTRWLLEDEENVRGLLEIVAEHLVGRLDFSQLSQINRSFIPDNLREQESDIVYSVPFRSESKTEELLIYILIEHQSTVDVTMGFRMLFYMTQIWDFQRREWESSNVPKSQWRLRPIIPIVFYTGEQSWQTPLTLSAMMDLPDMLSEFVPKFETLFLSVKDTEAVELTRTDHPFGWLLTVVQKEYAEREELRAALMAAVSHIDTLDEEKAHQWRRAIFYLYLLILHRRPSEEHEELKTLVHQQIQETSRREEGETMAQTMAEYLIEEGERRGERRGIEEGERRGERRGETQAKREAVLKLLRLRFDTVPEFITSRLTSIRSLSRLDSLFEKAVIAQTLDDIDWEGDESNNGADNG